MFTLNYGINCQQGNLINKQSLFLKMNYFLFIRITGIGLPNKDVYMITNATILITRYNGLLQPFTCHPTLKSSKMIVLDMGFNKISKLHKQNFIGLPHLIQLILDHNEITLVVESLFEDLTILKVLSLSNNKIISLFKCSFCSLNKLALLNLLKNNILFVHKTIYGNATIQLILTDNFPACCMYSNIGSVCTAKPFWPSSYQALLSNLGLELAFWSIGIIVVLFNLLSIYSNATPYQRKKKNYELYIIGMNSSDLMIGLYLISIAFADVIAGDNYIEIDLSWRAGFPCHALGFISLLATLTSTFVTLAVSIERYRVIKFPLSGKGGISIKSEAVVPITFTILRSTTIVLYIRHQVEGLSYLSSPLCILLGKSGNSMT